MKKLSLIMACAIPMAVALLALRASEDGASNGVGHRSHLAEATAMGDQPGARQPSSRQPNGRSPEARRVSHTSRTRPVLTIPDRDLPDSIEARPMTEWRAAQLDALPPYERNIVDYKLGLLARLRECLGDDWSADGTVNMIFHFDVDAETLAAFGTKAELFDSTISPENDERLVECATDAHRDQVLSLPESRVGPYTTNHYWGAKIEFPLGQDNVYKFFAK